MASLWVLCSARSYVLTHVMTTSFTSQSQHAAKGPECMPFIPTTAPFQSFKSLLSASLTATTHPRNGVFRWSLSLSPHSYHEKSSKQNPQQFFLLYPLTRASSQQASPLSSLNGYRVWCSGNIADSHSAARGSTPRIRKLNGGVNMMFTHPLF